MSLQSDPEVTLALASGRAARRGVWGVEADKPLAPLLPLIIHELSFRRLFNKLRCSLARYGGSGDKMALPDPQGAPHPRREAKLHTTEP